MTLQYGFASGRVFCLQAVFRKTGINALWFACLTTLAMVSWAGAPLAAQTAHFGFSQSTIGSNLLGPQGIAIGADGTIYVADTYNNRVVKEVPSGSGFTQVVIPTTPLAEPVAVAIDSSGNVYISDYGTGRVLEEVPGSGNAYTEIVVDTFPQPAGIAVSSTGVLYVGDPANRQVIAETHVGSGGFTHTSLFTNAYAIGVAVDGNGNVYLLDPNAKTVVKETYSSGSFSPSTIYMAPDVLYDQNIHADAAGNVYVATPSSNSVIKLSVDSTGNYTASTLFNSGLNYPLDAAVDSTGKLFIADYSNNRLLMVNFSGASFGSIPIATASTSQSLTFIFDSGGTLASTPYSVLTQGAPNLDFNAASTQPSSVCVSGHTYNAGDTCTVDVIFTPQLSGIRYGAATLSNSAGAVIATAYIYGTGTGPQVAFSPGIQSTLGSGFSYPFGVAVDGSGNVYVADSTNNAVKEIVAVGGSIPASPTINTLGSGFYIPTGVAVDGSGNIYVSDILHDTVKEIVAVGGSIPASPTIKTLGSGFLNPYGIAVDGSGNVFVADTNNNAVKEIVAVGGSIPASPTINTLGGGFLHPTGVAVDGRGNVYVADSDNNAVKEIVAVGGSIPASPTINTLGSGFSNPFGVAIDGSGNVYVADTGNNAVKEIVAVGGSIPASPIINTLGSGFSSPYDVGVDGSGNVYVADTRHNQVIKLDYADAPSLSFPTTAFGATSPSQTVTLSNIGNADLSLPTPGSGNNPALSTNFTLDSTSSGTCPLIGSTSSTAGTLASGASCSLPISFAPTVVGSISGSLVLTDNSLNATAPAYTTQVISLNGTATDPLARFTITGLSNAVAGTPKTITVTAVGASGSTETGYTGTIHFTSTDGIAVLPPDATLTSGTGTFSVTLKTAGNQSVTVTDTVTPSVTGSEYAMVTAAAANTISAVSGTPQSATIGSTFASPLMVKVVDAFNNPVSGVAVMFAGPASGAGATLSIPAATATNGTTSVTATANGTAGTSPYSVTARVAGVPTAASFSLTNTKSPTNVTVTPTAANSVYGQAVTLNAAVSPNSIAGSVPSGTVTFYDGTAALSPITTLAGAMASYAINVPTVGSHTYGAQYVGDANFSASPLTSATSAVLVGKAASTLTPSLTSQTLTYNTGGTISISVTGQFAGTGIVQPTGSITYTIGSGILQTAPITSNAATVTIPASLAACTYSIAVNYAGDGNYNAATQVTINLAIKQATTAVTWPTPAAITYGTPLSSTQLSATANVAGTFIYTPPTATILAAGPQTLGVTFTPTDTADYTATTDSVMLTVNKQASSITLTPSASSITPGQPVTFTAAVVPAANGSPSGTVSFYDGSTLLATSALSGGTATYSTSALLSGTHTISATYSGDTNYLGAATASSAGVTVTLLDFTFTTTGANYQTVLPGSAATFTYQIAPMYGATYPGAVTFTVSGCPLGASCTLSQTSLAANAGAQTVTLTIQTTIATAQNRRNKVTWSLALFLLPLVGVGRMRRSSQPLRKTLLLAVFLVVGGAALVGLSGCGSGIVAQPSPQNYAVSVTAASGAAQHVSTVTLNLQ